MAAEVTGFLAVVFMALATMTAIVGGYLLLNVAVSNIAKMSSYYTFLRVSDAISTSFKAGSSSATNLFLSPQYVLFTAYFTTEDYIPYFAFDGQRMNHIVINHGGPTAPQTGTPSLFEQVRSSSTGLAINNKDVTNRIELSKCARDACICIGEMTSFLDLRPEYFIPGACVEICWGEDLENYPDTEGFTNYDSCLNNPSNYNTYTTPRALYKYCNNQAASRGKNTMCQDCVDFMNAYNNKFELKEEKGYTVLMIKIGDPEDPNINNVGKLEQFSNAAKFSFIPQIIECKSMGELAETSGRNAYCSTGPPPAPYLFNYISRRGDEGIFGIMTVSVDEDYESGVLFKLINIDYFQDEVINPSTCYSANTFIKTEEGEEEGGFI
jgi:hypothetical protein